MNNGATCQGDEDSQNRYGIFQYDRLGCIIGIVDGLYESSAFFVGRFQCYDQTASFDEKGKQENDIRIDGIFDHHRMNEGFYPVIDCYSATDEEYSASGNDSPKIPLSSVSVVMILVFFLSGFFQSYHEQALIDGIGRAMYRFG